MGKQTLEKSASAWAGRLTEFRRHLHRYPELSDEEFETTARIKEWLEAEDIRIASYPLRTGLVAEVGGFRRGPVIALRADIDALPIQEETGLPFASEIPGRMHACGHDYHTAALIGAAYLLKEREEELQGTVRFLFQPAEERAHGARKVIESGALEGVSAVFGMHNKPDLPVGTVGIKSGPLMAAADGFAVEITGYGSHAALPEAGVDPIVTAAHIVTALQSVVSRSISALESAVVSVTRIRAGDSWNVIPDKAVLDGTVRTFDDKVRKRVLSRFGRVVENVAAAYGAEARIKWIPGPPPVHNDEALAELARKTADGLGLLSVVPVPSPAGEDFAEYQQHVPGLFVFMGTSGSQAWHHPSFDLDERAIPLAADFFAHLAEQALNHFASSPASANADKKED